jgi:hypothetical protein
VIECDQSYFNMINFCEWPNERQSRARHGKRRMRRPRLDGVGISQVHQLEPRMLLSTIVVSTANDSGAGSLRAAVTDATNGDAIVFAKRLAGHTITLRSEIDITSNISISGPAGRPVVLSGGGATRVLEVDGAKSAWPTWSSPKGALLLAAVSSNQAVA